MFEDQNAQKAGVPPANLPVGKVEDIFDVEEAAEASAPSALSAGALRSKERPPAPPSPPSPPAGLPDESLAKPMYPLKAPKLSRYLMTVGLIALAVGVLGGIGWFLYASFVREGVSPQQAPEAPPPAPLPAPAGVPEAPPPPLSEDITDERVLFGEPIDADGDGLDYAREQALGTDPYNWDTDGDGLSDYDEVAIWKTDPLNADTDGDTYKDGDEVKNGYNPAGPGKIFEPPTQE